MNISHQNSSFKYAMFPTNLDTINHEIHDLFNHLTQNLKPMQKQGAMSGRCELQTAQMEMFLRKNFGFKNIPGEYIVQGVRSFRVDRLPSSSTFDPETVIKFPNEEYKDPFVMTIDEIRKWQHSYVVYATQDEDLSIDKEFLKRALQGQSESGEEAFRMKFVVRISTCPILMEFDGCIISRTLEEDWPNRIKLVSVTGVDFAGRIHDINDIFTYVDNWREVYQIDHRTGKLVIYGGRDFYALGNVRAKLNSKRLYDDLLRMARTRLSACDREGVQIVVETGIGLGVFAGRQIGIDDQTRSLSAHAIKQVLEEDASKYKNIKAVVFAMPIFERDETTSTYHCFVETFKNKYCGSIPILIADQDMHRLTVAIARKGYHVSELNPADSHGVFGEYWQNRGPAVEEKLALTTVGLLVQHHLFNEEHVMNSEKYAFLPTNNNQCSHTIISIPTPPLIIEQLIQDSEHPLHWIWGWLMWIILFRFVRKHLSNHIL